MARRTRPWLMLAVALASGGLAALLAMRYLQQRTTPLSAQPIRSNMVVAARPLPVGTILADQHVKTIEWTGGALPLGYIGNPQDVVGRGLISDLQENEPLLEAKLAPKGAGGGLPIIISEGKRALTMRVNEVSGVAGFVTPNTRVDVLLTMENQNTGGEQATRIIMQDMRVLAAGQSIQPDKEGKPRSVAGRDLPGHAGTGGDPRAGLAAGQHPARASEPAGYDGGEDLGDPAERAHARPGRCGPGSPRDGTVHAGAGGDSAVPGCGSVSGWRSHPHEVLSLTSTR